MLSIVGSEFQTSSKLLFMKRTTRDDEIMMVHNQHGVATDDTDNLCYAPEVKLFFAECRVMTL